MKRLAAVLVITTLWVVACATTRDRGAIRGTVFTGGAALPGVTVTLSGTGSGSRTAVTDVNGQYVFHNLAAGRYVIRAELEGLQPQTTIVRVGPGRDVKLETELRMSSVAEAITVTAEATGVTASPAGYFEDFNGRPAHYAQIKEHQFVETSKQRTTTFAIDVDRASYSNVRRFLNDNEFPPADAVRIEEMINYFPYSYPLPTGSEPFSVTTEAASCPWNLQNRLLRIGLQGKNLDQWQMASNNLVFLIDVSGSMQPPERLPLLKSAFRMLVDELRAQDSVSIVVYAGAAGLVLPRTSGADRQTIIDALDKLQAGGSTAGGEGIELAYKTAKDNFILDGNNRVILATDGDFNVGISSLDDLTTLIEEKREHDIFLTVLGVGDDNLQDSTMELLADKGNGNYFYLDTIKEAEKVFAGELTGTLVTIAKDVKVQIQFDPNTVRSYRQIGYENRALDNEDFDNDKKDAGELGAGHSVTALYEIVPRAGASSRSLGTVKLRYKEPRGTTSRLLTHAITDDGKDIYAASPDMQFAASVAEFGMLLRDSPHKGKATYADALALARAARGTDLEGYREELIRMVETSAALDERPELASAAGQ